MKTQQSTLERVIPFIHEFTHANKTCATVTSDSTFVDLGLDDLDYIELVMLVEEELEIHLPNPDVDDCKTVGELVKLIEMVQSC